MYLKSQSDDSWIRRLSLLAIVVFAAAVVIELWPLLPAWGRAIWAASRAVVRFWSWPWWIWLTISVSAFAFRAWLRSRQNQ